MQAIIAGLKGLIEVEFLDWELAVEELPRITGVEIKVDKRNEENFRVKLGQHWQA